MEILFGKRLRDLRQEKGLRQSDVARHLEVSSATVTRWENGKQQPDYLVLAKLAKFFGVTADYLLGLEK